jgi:hypothetical protein
LAAGQLLTVSITSSLRFAPRSKIRHLGAESYWNVSRSCLRNQNLRRTNLQKNSNLAVLFEPHRVIKITFNESDFAYSEAVTRG